MKQSDSSARNRKRIEDLRNIQSSLREGLVLSEKALEMHRLTLFWASIIFLSIFLLDIQASSITILGVRIDNIDFRRTSLLIPVAIAYEIIYYSYKRLRHRFNSLKLRAVDAEIEIITGIQLELILAAHPYRSKSGIVYRITESESLMSFILKLMAVIRWIPVFSVFAIGTFYAISVSSGFPNPVYRLISYTILVICCALILLAILTRAYAYRIHEPLSTPKEKSVDP